MISSEEVGQEAFQALLANSYERLQALFITEAEMRSLRMSEKEIARIKGQIARAPAKFKATAATLSATYRFKYVESAVPNCVPGDSLGMDSDLIRFPFRSVLYQVGPDQHKFLQTGEMILVGSAWCLADAPGDPAITEITTGGDPRIPDILAKINRIDTTQPQNSNGGMTPAEVNRMIERAGLVEQLLTIMSPQNPEREQWYKQLLDNLASAAPKHNGALKKLGDYRAQLEKAMPGSEMAGYAKYREICAIFLEKLSRQSAG